MASDLTARLGGARSTLAYKAPCRVGAVSNISLTGTQTIDGVAVVAEDRVLVMGQTDQTENGVYTVKATAWQRARDFDGTGDVVTGTRVYVHSGTDAVKGAWVVTTADPITIGSSNIVFETALASDYIGVYEQGGTDVAVVDGGTGASTAAAGFDNLSPTTTRGDLIARGAAVNQRLPVGNSGYALISDGVDPAWTGFAHSGTGAVTRGWVTRLRETGWYSVKDFGAVGDGTTDDLAAINNAIAACPATGGVVFFPPGTYRITDTLNIGNGDATTLATRQNITLLGASFSGTQNLSEINSAAGTAFRGPSIIKFDGTLNDTAVTTGGPGVIHMESLCIDGNAKAGTGLEVSHNWNSTFRNITIIGWRTNGMYLSAFGDAATGSGLVSIGCMDNTFEKIRISKAATTSNNVALLVGRDVDDATYGYPGVDVARCRFTDCNFICRDDATCSSVVLRYCDLNTFENCFLYSEFSSGASPADSAPIRLLSGTSAAPASNSFPSGNVFNNCPATGAATMIIDADWYSSPTNNGNIWFFPHTDETGSPPAWPVNPRYGGIFGFSHSGHWLGPQMGVRLGNLIDGVTRSVLYRVMTAVTVQSTTTATAILTRQIPAYLMQNYLCTTYGTHANDRQLRVRVHGRYVNNTGANRTLTITGTYGSTQMFYATLVIPTSANRRIIDIEAVLTAKDNSAAKQHVWNSVRVSEPQAAEGQSVGLLFDYVGTKVTLAENSATPLSLTITVQHSNADTIFIADAGTIELL